MERSIWNQSFPGGSALKNLSAKQDTHVPSLGWEDPLEKEMATHSSILAWKIPQRSLAEESIGSQKESNMIKQLNNSNYCLLGLFPLP